MPAEPAAYRPVIVIPVYNHPATVEDVVRRLLSTGTPVILVDDASDPPAQEACERCRSMGAGLVRRQSTGGRGASIRTGFKAARQAGFTHALVFDAGGRHDPAAVGSFLELSRKHPNDLVCGYARTSSAYPARARLARRMADAGACLAALSLAPKDVMCRLRVYPLAAVSQLSACIGLGRRAEFEFESLVRLMWMGLRLRELPVDPRPPADGVSHYQPVRDTLRIAGMSAKLFIIMLTRLPAVLISRSTGWSPAPGLGSEHPQAHPSRSPSDDRSRT